MPVQHHTAARGVRAGSSGDCGGDDSRQHQPSRVVCQRSRCGQEVIAIGDEHEALLRAVLPPAMEVMTAWSAAEEGDPALFRQALRRVLSEALDAPDPSQAVAEMVFACRRCQAYFWTNSQVPPGVPAPKYFTMSIGAISARASPDVRLMPTGPVTGVLTGGTV